MSRTVCPVLPPSHKMFGLILLIFLCIGSNRLFAAELTFAIHPLLPDEHTRQIYQPLADYLARTTGEKIRLITNANFLTHWQAMKQESYDLILDGPHFTAYRAEKMGYTVLAKLPGLISHSLVCSAEQMFLEPADLIGKTIATTSSPSLAALYLAQIYPNPMRQPDIVETVNVEQAAELAVGDKVAAAIIPTPLLARYPDLVTIHVTGQDPALGISAGPNVQPELQVMLRQALLNAHRDPAGRAVLEAMNVEVLEPADAGSFRGTEQLLEGIWGF